ncbi:DUF3969 family protein [Salmonella enterica]|uniref:DUF3969 family protein n=1 Tax=Salmonella enterica TaxID=28901 RepID=UPI0018D1BD67|nr:DUF3969 family protein [Salmonella enterica]MBH0368992.1 DUF3969 family protein [Salmonella enterica]MBH0487738.1 DUF3969 family protein [Salmonella enterica]MBH5276742.1 DUF3969 family protein [Salmonella enterica]MBH5285602.1 DUF3969 family protein [Salmonella enterica]MDO3891477.1 DUF3969 family protein [Salmonella enterica]
MRFNYSIDNEHAEKFISLLALGVLYSIKEKAISIDEAEVFIFTPSTSSILNEAGYSNALVDIIDSGCELEDVADLIPERLTDNVKDLISKTLSLIRASDYIAGTIDKKINLIE